MYVKEEWNNSGLVVKQLQEKDNVSLPRSLCASSSYNLKYGVWNNIIICCITKTEQILSRISILLITFKDNIYSKKILSIPCLTDIGGSASVTSHDSFCIYKVSFSVIPYTLSI